MVNNMVMFKVNVFEVKAKLSDTSTARRAGNDRDCRHNKPVATASRGECDRATPRGSTAWSPPFRRAPFGLRGMPADELEQ